MAVCEAQAITRGAEQMVMSVVELNEQAFRFYSLQGYSRMPERDWSPPRSSRCFTVPNPVRCYEPLTENLVPFARNDPSLNRAKAGNLSWPELSGLLAS